MKRIGKQLLVSALLLNTFSPMVVSAAELTDQPVEQSVSVPVEIPVEQLQMSQQEGVRGDTIFFSLPLGVGMDEAGTVAITLYNAEHAAHEQVALAYDGETALFEGSFAITEALAAGLWQIESIAFTKQETTHYVHNRDLIIDAEVGAVADLSGYGVTVPEAPVELGAAANQAAPEVEAEPFVSYAIHIQSEGWTDYVKNGEMSGTTGRGLRLEGIRMQIFDPVYSGSLSYRTHIQSIGWQDWKTDDALSGTEGRSLRLEAIQIKLEGELAEVYDVYYRVHAQSFGWLDWAKNGEAAGTEGLALRLEGIEVVLVEKGGPAPGAIDRNFVLSSPSVNYTTHVQKEGWQTTVSNGAMSGTSGKALRLEGILMNVFTQSLTGDIQYRTHVQKEGWQDWKQNWELSGTQGKALRLEAIEIRLTDEMAKFYDVYYRVHAQTYGWLGWAKNGESAGTEGLAKRLEGIEVRLVRKGGTAPGSTARAFVKK